MLDACTEMGKQTVPNDAGVVCHDRLCPPPLIRPSTSSEKVNRLPQAHYKTDEQFVLPLPVQRPRKLLKVKRHEQRLQPETSVKLSSPSNFRRPDRSFQPPPSAFRRPVKKPEGGFLVDDPGRNVAFLEGNIASVVRTFGASIQSHPPSVYAIFQLKASIPCTKGEKVRFFWEGPKKIQLIVDEKPFAIGGMRAAYKAHVTQSAGMLCEGDTYVLKEHTEDVMNEWQGSYACEAAARSKLCEKVCVLHFRYND